MRSALGEEATRHLPRLREAASKVVRVVAKLERALSLSGVYVLAFFHDLLRVVGPVAIFVLVCVEYEFVGVPLLLGQSPFKLESVCVAKVVAVAFEGPVHLCLIIHLPFLVVEITATGRHFSVVINVVDVSVHTNLLITESWVDVWISQDTARRLRSDRSVGVRRISRHYRQVLGLQALSVLNRDRRYVRPGHNRPVAGDAGIGPVPLGVEIERLTCLHVVRRNIDSLIIG